MTRTRCAIFHALGPVLALATAGCAPAPAPAPAPASASPAASAASEAEARAFMAGYAADLLAHDRAAIAARYDPAGAWMVFEGERAFQSSEAIAALYATGWQGPDSFAWRDLHYDVLAPGTVLVVGGFDWGWQGRSRAMTYTGILQQGPGGWRIRFENEGREPPAAR